MAVIRTVCYRNGGVVINDSLFASARSVESWIDDLCLQKGSSLSGRRQSFTFLTGQKQKIPVYVSRDLILVPLQAAGDLDGEWINWSQDPERIPEKTSRNIRTFLRAIEAPLRPDFR